MSQVAIVIDSPDYPAAHFSGTDLLSVGLEATRLVRAQLPIADNVKLSSIRVDTVVDIDPTFTTFVHAGAAAGDVTGITGITAAKTLISVVGVKDSDQTSHDFTSEFVPLAGKINNDGGTSTSGYHLVVTWR